MSGTVNKVILIGNMGQDPEVRTLQDGSYVANISIATSERWKDGSGQRQERTQWHRVVVWNAHLVKVVRDYARKGSKVYIEGQLENRKWQDSDGLDRWITEVVIRPYRGALHLVGGKPDGAGPESDGNQGASTSPTDMDDEIPF